MSWKGRHDLISQATCEIIIMMMQQGCGCLLVFVLSSCWGTPLNVGSYLNVCMLWEAVVLIHWTNPVEQSYVLEGEAWPDQSGDARNQHHGVQQGSGCLLVFVLSSCWRTPLNVVSYLSVCMWEALVLRDWRTLWNEGMSWKGKLDRISLESAKSSSCNATGLMHTIEGRI